MPENISVLRHFWRLLPLRILATSEHTTLKNTIGYSQPSLNGRMLSADRCSWSAHDLLRVFQSETPICSIILGEFAILGEFLCNFGGVFCVILLEVLLIHNSRANHHQGYGL